MSMVDIMVVGAVSSSMDTIKIGEYPVEGVY
jgi:hypothetical protein